MCNSATKHKEKPKHSPSTSVILIDYQYNSPLFFTRMLIFFMNHEYYCSFNVRRVWRHQRVNHNPYIAEGQTTQCPKEKGQKDKQRSTKYCSTQKTKDRVTRTPLKTGGRRCSGRASSPCSTNDTRCVTVQRHQHHLT
jgi:hypothetical protein